MQRIRSGDCEVSIPEGYEIVEHDHYQEQRTFFEDLPTDDPLIAEVLRGRTPDWQTIRKMRNSFEVRMGDHLLLFHTQEHGQPEDLADFILSQTKQRVVLSECLVGDCLGKAYGQYSDDMTWMDWWAKKGTCMICFNLQGRGIPVPRIKQDVETILRGTKWIAEPDAGGNAAPPRASA